MMAENKKAPKLLKFSEFKDFLVHHSGLARVAANAVLLASAWKSKLQS